VRGGVLVVRVPRTGTRLVVVRAKGCRPLQLRVWRAPNGIGRFKRLS